MGKYETYKETEQEIKIQAQKQQIEKMSLRIGQLEEQYKSKEKHMMGEIQRLLHVEEMARGLCQKILDKDRREIVLGTSHSWSSMPSEQMIETALKSYRTYCEKRTKDMQKIGEYASGLSEKYEELVEKNAELKKTIEEYEREGPVSAKKEKEIRSMVNGKTVVGDVEVNATIEPDDEEDLEGVKTVKPAVKKETKGKPPEKKKESPHALSADEQELESGVRLVVSQMADGEKHVLKLIGDGMSVMYEIRKAAAPQVADSTAYRYITSFIKEEIVEAIENINFPGTKKCTLVKLTKKGRIAYRLITGEDPEEPEMERIRKVHAGYEHGYGIRACQRLLERSERYESVNMFAEKIKLPDGTQGYIPDLKCMRIDESGNKITEYFEFERCKQKDVEYYAKFGKMSMITDEINVIVANPSEHEKMQRLLAAWANPKKTIPGYPRKIIRLSNYNRIRDCITKGKPFAEWWYITDYLKDFKPPMGYVGPLNNEE
jgi:hypothetical protein